MDKPLKKLTNCINFYLKKSHKIITLLIIFLFLSTILSASVNSNSIKLNSTKEEEIKNNNKLESPLKRILESKSIKERLSWLQEKIINLKYSRDD